MDPRKFSSQFQKHLDDLAELGFKFNEEATMVHLPTGQPMVLGNFRTNTDAFDDYDDYQESRADLHDEGGRVGSILFATGRVPEGEYRGVPIASMSLNAGPNDQMLGRQVKWDINRDSGEPQVTDFLNTGLSNEGVAEHVNEATRAPVPIQTPGRVSVVDSIGRSGRTKFTMSRNRKTGNWDQVPD